MTGREDGCSVFQGNTNHLRAVVGSQTEFIADGCYPQIARRHLASLAVRTYRVDGIVCSTIHNLSILHEVVACNSVDGRNGTGPDRRVADGCNRRDIRNLAVFYAESFAEHSLESAFAVAGVVAIEIIPSHLVDNDAYNELRALRLSLCNAAEAAEHEDEFDNLIHSQNVFFIHNHSVLYITIRLQRYNLFWYLTIKKTIFT